MPAAQPRISHRRHILAIDIGGTSVKLRVSNRHSVVSFDSSPSMTPRDFVRGVKKLIDGWQFDRVTIGYPGMVIDGRIVSEPANLGHGWVAHDFAKAFACPTRILNDAVMQAIGSYRGGRMLFLGFGTGLGAVAILESKIFPMELAHLPFAKRGSVQDSVGNDAKQRLGRKRWSANARKIIYHLHGLLAVEDVVLGGGNAAQIHPRPRRTRLGDNDFAFKGGFRAWNTSLGRRL